MLVENFKSKCGEYENFQIWDVENLEAFFKGNGVIKEIFEKEYKIKLDSFLEKRDLLPNSDIDIVERLLDHVGNKHFFAFTYHSKNHMELILMQEQKVMNFGIDIKEVDKEHAFVVIMDKKEVYAN